MKKIDSRRSCPVLEVLMAVLIGMMQACTTPSRPGGIPASARWAGGPDGGEWVFCSSGTGGNNICQIFTDRGVLLFASEYKLKNLDRPAVDQELRYRYVDGTTILLKGGLALVPVSQRSTQSQHR